MTAALTVRPATPSDHPLLNEIALAAKAFWGYAPAVLDAWRADLTVSLASLSACPTRVAVAEDAIIGFGQLDPASDPWDLNALWVAPTHMRRGAGKQLVRSLMQVAFEAGQRVLAIDADPNALPFYRACGARLVGQRHAPIPGEPGRLRPQLELATRTAG